MPQYVSISQDRVPSFRFIEINSEKWVDLSGTTNRSFMVYLFLTYGRRYIMVHVFKKKYFGIRISFSKKTFFAPNLAFAEQISLLLPPSLQFLTLPAIYKAWIATVRGVSPPLLNFLDPKATNLLLLYTQSVHHPMDCPKFRGKPFWAGVLPCPISWKFRRSVEITMQSWQR